MSDAPAASLGRREQKKLETRNALIYAARQLFSSQGYENTTVEQLADWAAISKPTFFKYFASKADLLNELMLDIDGRYERTIDRAKSEYTHTADRIAYFFAYSAEIVKKTPDLTRTLAAEALTRVRESDDDAAKHLGRSNEALKHMLLEGIERGEVRSDYPVEFLIQMISGIYNTVLMNWLTASDYPLEENLTLASQFVAESIRPQQ